MCHHVAAAFAVTCPWQPENLLMDATGYIKVIDFGFAKRIPFEKSGALQTKSFTLCGTPEYLSPELVLSRGHDKSVDYWALGCLVYELLVGRTPFQDDNQVGDYSVGARARLVCLSPTEAAWRGVAGGDLQEDHPLAQVPDLPPRLRRRGHRPHQEAPGPQPRLQDRCVRPPPTSASSHPSSAPPYTPMRECMRFRRQPAGGRA
jgi:serine/threonine protein kinase